MLDTVRMELGEVSGLRAGTDARAAMPVRTWRSENVLVAEVSLPRLVFGFNGRVIANQEELQAAFTKLAECVERVGEVWPVADWKPRRLDLVWQWAGREAGKVIDCMSGFRFPGVAAPPLHQAGRCLTFTGGGRKFQLQLYDKTKKHRLPGDVLRVEARLRGIGLRQLRGRDWRDFASLWVTFREIVLRLPEVPRPTAKCGWPEVCACYVPAELREAALHAACPDPRSRRRNRQRMKLAEAQLPEGLKWADLLPTDGPPPPVHVEPPRRKGAR